MGQIQMAAEKMDRADRELLGIAQKKCKETLLIRGWSLDTAKGMRIENEDGEWIGYWNPLMSNPDAQDLGESAGLDQLVKSLQLDPSEANRRAIVVAAAALVSECERVGAHW